MAEPNLTPPLHEPPPPGADHQDKDFPVNSVLKFAAWFVVAVVVIHGIILLYLYSLADRFKGTQLGPDSQVQLKNIVPEPRKGDAIARPRPQVSDVTDLNKLRAEEDAKLEGYRWVDRDKGIVHIPIERAMDILADRDQAAKHGVRWQRGRTDSSQSNQSNQPKTKSTEKGQ